MHKMPILLILLSVYGGRICAQDIQPPKSDTSSDKSVMTDMQQARNKAVLILGVSDSSGICGGDKVSCAILSYGEDDSPFVHDRISNDSIWRVVIKDVSVKSGRDPVKRDFEVLLDPEDGSLLKVYSMCDPCGSSDTLPKPSAAEADEYLRSIHFKYAGILSYEPQISFLEALTVCPLDPASAKEIEGYLIDHDAEREDDDAWLIILRGTEVLVSLSGRAKPGEIPDNLRNWTMCEVNAKSGELLYYQTPPRQLK